MIILEDLDLHQKLQRVKWEQLQSELVQPQISANFLELFIILTSLIFVFLLFIVPILQQSTEISTINFTLKNNLL